VEKVPGMDCVMPLVVSVMLTFVYVTDANCRLWPGGQEKPPGPGGLRVSDAVTFPFLPELNVPVALTGAVIDDVSLT
jgi:hypothetical protein